MKHIVTFRTWRRTAKDCLHVFAIYDNIDPADHKATIEYLIQYAQVRVSQIRIPFPWGGSSTGTGWR